MAVDDADAQQAVVGEEPHVQSVTDVVAEGSAQAGTSPRANDTEDEEEDAPPAHVRKFRLSVEGVDAGHFDGLDLAALREQAALCQCEAPDPSLKDKYDELCRLALNGAAAIDAIGLDTKKLLDMDAETLLQECVPTGRLAECLKGARALLKISDEQFTKMVGEFISTEVRVEVEGAVKVVKTSRQTWKYRYAWADCLLMLKDSKENGCVESAAQLADHVGTGLGYSNHHFVTGLLHLHEKTQAAYFKGLGIGKFESIHHELREQSMREFNLCLFSHILRSQLVCCYPDPAERAQVEAVAHDKYQVLQNPEKEVPRVAAEIYDEAMEFIAMRRHSDPDGAHPEGHANLPSTARANWHEYMSHSEWAAFADRSIEVPNFMALLACGYAVALSVHPRPDGPLPTDESVKKLVLFKVLGFICHGVEGVTNFHDMCAFARVSAMAGAGKTEGWGCSFAELLLERDWARYKSHPRFQDCTAPPADWTPVVPEAEALRSVCHESSPFASMATDDELSGAHRKKLHDSQYLPRMMDVVFSRPEVYDDTQLRDVVLSEAFGVGQQPRKKAKKVDENGNPTKERGSKANDAAAALGRVTVAQRVKAVQKEHGKAAAPFHLPPELRSFMTPNAEGIVPYNPGDLRPQTKANQGDPHACYNRVMTLALHTCGNQFGDKQKVANVSDLANLLEGNPDYAAGTKDFDNAVKAAFGLAWATELKEHAQEWWSAEMCYFHMCRAQVRDQEGFDKMWWGLFMDTPEALALRNQLRFEHIPEVQALVQKRKDDGLLTRPAVPTEKPLPPRRASLKRRAEAPALENGGEDVGAEGADGAEGAEEASLDMAPFQELLHQQVRKGRAGSGCDVFMSDPLRGAVRVDGVPLFPHAEAFFRFINPVPREGQRIEHEFAMGLYMDIVLETAVIDFLPGAGGSTAFSAIPNSALHHTRRTAGTNHESRRRKVRTAHMSSSKTNGGEKSPYPDADKNKAAWDLEAQMFAMGKDWDESQQDGSDGAVVQEVPLSMERPPALDAQSMAQPMLQLVAQPVAQPGDQPGDQPEDQPMAQPEDQPGAQAPSEQ